MTKTVGAGTPEENEYDLFGRLTNADGAVYTYGPDDLRRTKVIGANTTQFVWNNDNMVAELVSGAVQTRYLYGINLICSIAGTTTKYYLYNAHGDVVQLASSTGAVIKTYRYDAFGVEVSPDANDANPFRYCGQYFDKETGTYYLRARYYDPEIGRFISQDGMEYAKDKDPLSLNLYTYCSGNPVMYDDPSGHWINFVIGAVAGALVGGGVDMISQLIENGGNFDKVDWRSVGLSSLSGAASGLLAATGVGLVGSVLGNAAISGGVSLLNQVTDEEKGISKTAIIADTIFGGIAGGLGGAGKGGSASLKTANKLLSTNLKSAKSLVTKSIKGTGKAVVNSIKNYAKNKAVQSFYKEFSPGKLAKEIVKGVACDFGSKALQIETDYIRYPNYKVERSHG